MFVLMCNVILMCVCVCVNICTLTGARIYVLNVLRMNGRAKFPVSAWTKTAYVDVTSDSENAVPKHERGHELMCARYEVSEAA